MDPTAQGQQTPAVNGEVPQQVPGQEPGAQQPQSQGEGIQARIDQLTAQMREAQRVAAEAQRVAAEQQQLNAQLTAQFLQSQQAQQPAGPQLDPELRTQLDAYMGPLLGQLRQNQQMLKAQTAAMQAQQAASPFGAEAQSLAARYAQTNPGISPALAVQLAVGELAQRQFTQPGQRQPNAALFAAQNLPPAPAPVVAAQSQQPQLAPLPANFDSMDPLQQVEWFEKNRPDTPF